MKRLRGCLILVAALLILYMMGSSGNKRGDGLPTLAVLPSITPTIDLTSVAAAATSTESPSVTIIPTIESRSGFVTITPAPGTVYPTATITETPTITDEPTITMVPNSTATPAPTQGIDVRAISPTTYYLTRDAKIRACASTQCEHLGTLNQGVSVIVTGTTDGEEVTAGTKMWYEVQYGGRTAFIYSPSLTNVAPVRLVTAAPQPVSPVIIQPNLPVAGVCPDINATCKQLQTCEQARACLAAGNGDLDADHKGNPCEDLCGDE